MFSFRSSTFGYSTSLANNEYKQSSIYSDVTRISAIKSGSTRNSAITNANSNITEFISSKLVVDEYGVTDKICRNCGKFLLLDEVLAYAIPMDFEGRSKVDVESIDIENLECTCLACYSEIINNRISSRRES